VLTSTAPFTCAASISSSDLGVHTVLAPGRNVVELPALRPGTYGYSCTMGMYTCRIIVIAPPKPAA